MKSIKNIFKNKIGICNIRICICMYKLKDKGIVGQMFFSIYRTLLQIINISTFSVLDRKHYSEKVDAFIMMPIEENRIGVRGKVLMVGESLDNNELLISKKIPDLDISLFKNVNITGNSDIIVDINNDCVISDSAYNISNNEEVVDGLLYRARNRVCLLRKNLKKIHDYIDCGIMVSGKFSYNYYHIVFENLIRLLYISKLNIPIDIPLIMDKRTIDIPSCKRIFEILTQDINRGIVLIDPDKVYHINNLYHISAINFFPAHILNTKEWDGLYLYSQESVLKLKRKLIEFKSNKKYGNKIFISRANMCTRQFNEDEVYSVLEKYGFERIFPEELSFEDQMSLFNSAEYIVGGSGAALTNLLFVNSNCTIICFGISSSTNNNEIPVFNTIANINGAKFFFFPRSDSRTSIHSNFTVDCRILEDTISNLLNKNAI